MEPGLEVKTIEGITAVRTLRAELMGLAVAVADDPSQKRILVLASPGISDRRLAEEWRAVGRALRPDLLERLSLVAMFPSGVRRYGASLGPELEASPLAARRAGAGDTRLPPPDFSFVVPKLLVYAWLTNTGPVTATWLGQTAGCSYPSVKRALRRLGDSLIKHPDRRVELRRFPREEWSRMIAVSPEARSVIRFTDRSGQPRTAADLLRRLERVRSVAIAVGGAVGARHYYPELDLVGAPQLDLSVHAPKKHADLGFVKRLDPALERSTDPHEPAQLVVHFIRHRAPLFVKDSAGATWADPVECLLDLHEARLEPQAAELLRGFEARRRATR